MAEKEYNPVFKYEPQFVREIPPDDVDSLLVSARKCLFGYREQAGSLSADVPNALWGKIKRDIARFLTIIRESTPFIRLRNG